MYTVLPHTADVGLELKAKSLEDLFRDAAAGWKYLVIENSETRNRENKKIRLQAASLEDLLVQWLNELNYLLTVKRWIFHQVETMEIHQKNNTWQLEAQISGEPFDLERHQVAMEIKAVTYHQLNIQKKNGEYFTRVIFDI